MGQDLLALAPEERARAGMFLGFQYPVEIPGVNNVYLLKAAVNAKRKARGRARSRRLRIPAARARQDEAHADGRELPVARRQRRLLGRRKEAQRDPADAGARARARGARRDRLRPRHRRAEGRGARRQHVCAPPIAACCSSRTTSGCSITSCPTTCTCWRAAGSRVRATRRWRTSSRNAATTGCSRSRDDLAADQQGRELALRQPASARQGEDRCGRRRRGCPFADRAARRAAGLRALGVRRRPVRAPTCPRPRQQSCASLLDAREAGEEFAAHARRRDRRRRRRLRAGAA